MVGGHGSTSWSSRKDSPSRGAPRDHDCRAQLENPTARSAKPATAPRAAAAQLGPRTAHCGRNAGSWKARGGRRLKIHVLHVFWAFQRGEPRPTEGSGNLVKRAFSAKMAPTLA